MNKSFKIYPKKDSTKSRKNEKSMFAQKRTNKKREQIEKNNQRVLFLENF